MEIQAKKSGHQAGLPQCPMIRAVFIGTASAEIPALWEIMLLTGKADSLSRQIRPSGSSQ